VRVSPTVDSVCPAPEGALRKLSAALTPTYLKDPIQKLFQLDVAVVAINDESACGRQGGNTAHSERMTGGAIRGEFNYRAR
jgi:hypothetical protein